jgi:hypothetical protein
MQLFFPTSDASGWGLLIVCWSYLLYMQIRLTGSTAFWHMHVWAPCFLLQIDSSCWKMLIKQLWHLESSMHCCWLPVALFTWFCCVPWYPIPNHPLHESLLAFVNFGKPSISHRDRRAVPWSFPCLVLFSESCFHFIYQSHIFSFRKNACLLARSVRISTHHFLKSIVLSIRRSCTQKPYRFLDTIALILCRCCMIRTVL